MLVDVATKSKWFPLLIQMCSVLYRRSWREDAHAGHRVPDHRGSQLSGVLSGSAWGVPRGAMQTQPGVSHQTLLNTTTSSWGYIPAMTCTLTALNVIKIFPHICSSIMPVLIIFHQVKINTGVAIPDRMAPGYLNHLDLGEAVAMLIERRNTSHTVFPVSCPADLKTVILEGNL